MLVSIKDGKQLIDYSVIETLFLDAGNTLISIDFERIAQELKQRGVTCSADTICRAEAAARPQVSLALAESRTTEGLDSFGRLLLGIFSCLEEINGAGHARELAADLGPVLLTPGRSDLLWCAVMPGVPQALSSFKESGLDLVLVSNSDGTVEQNLKANGLATYFSHIVDSAIVGVEKPDPGIFDHALSLSGAHKETTVHVGDMYFADIAGAQAAGLKAILLDPFSDWQNVDCAKTPNLQALAKKIEDAQFRIRS